MIARFEPDARIRMVAASGGKSRSAKRIVPSNWQLREVLPHYIQNETAKTTTSSSG